MCSEIRRTTRFIVAVSPTLEGRYKLKMKFYGTLPASQASTDEDCAKNPSNCAAIGVRQAFQPDTQQGSREK
jgi:hypothetical protein